MEFSTLRRAFCLAFVVILSGCNQSKNEVEDASPDASLLNFGQYVLTSYHRDSHGMLPSEWGSTLDVSGNNIIFTDSIFACQTFVYQLKDNDTLDYISSDYSENGCPDIVGNYRTPKESSALRIVQNETTIITQDGKQILMRDEDVTLYFSPVAATCESPIKIVKVESDLDTSHEAYEITFKDEQEGNIERVEAVYNDLKRFDVYTTVYNMSQNTLRQLQCDESVESIDAIPMIMHTLRVASSPKLCDKHDGQAFCLQTAPVAEYDIKVNNLSLLEFEWGHVKEIDTVTFDYEYHPKGHSNESFYESVAEHVTVIDEDEIGTQYTFDFVNVYGFSNESGQGYLHYLPFNCEGDLHPCNIALSPNDSEVFFESLTLEYIGQGKVRLVDIQSDADH